jgi:hypothetical protein
MTYRLGLFDVMISGAAVLTVLILAIVLQRGGLAQPFALAIGVPCSLLVLYPAIRRRSRGRLKFYKWAIVAVLVGLFGMLFDLAAMHL